MQSANQKWRESGTTLSFKDWLNREKQKGIVIPQKGVTDIYMNYISGESTIDTKLKPIKSKEFLGLKKNVLFISGLLIVSAFVYKFYKNK